MGRVAAPSRCRKRREDDHEHISTLTGVPSISVPFKFRRRAFCCLPTESRRRGTIPLRELPKLRYGT